MLEPLNFPNFEFKFKADEKGNQIFDPIRRKYISLTPEEWVRQHVLAYLSGALGYPSGLLSVEKSIQLNGMQKRYDVVAYNREGEPVLVVECKAPGVKITQETFDQVARYNLVLKVEHLLVTNGISHIACKIDAPNNTYKFLDKLPPFSEIT